MNEIDKKNNCIEASIIQALIETTDRYKYLCHFLESRDINFYTQEFNSLFGLGRNIIVEINNKSTESILISAHYDDKGIYDNSGGVYHTLSLCEQLSSSSFNSNFILIFSDQEESFQQGMYHFLQKNKKLQMKFHLNFDGIGIGEELILYNSHKGYLVVDWLKDNKDKAILLTDNSPFLFSEIKSFHIFSCLKNDALKTIESQMLHKGFKSYFNEEWCLANFKINYFKSSYLPKTIKLILNLENNNLEAKDFSIINETI